MIPFTKVNPRVDLGLIPSFLDANDPRKASEQIEDRYSFGGGWSPLAGFKMNPDRSLQYVSPGVPDDEQDPPLQVLAEGKLRDETILFYRHAWVAIVQPDGSFEASRID